MVPTRGYGAITPIKTKTRSKNISSKITRKENRIFSIDVIIDLRR